MDPERLRSYAGRFPKRIGEKALLLLHAASQLNDYLSGLLEPAGE